MDWPQYTSIEDLLAARQGKFGSLSIVVRLSAPELSRTRVNLASVGLAPGAGAGLAAIVREFEGHVHAFYTSPDHPYRLGFSDHVPGDGEFVVRTKDLEGDAAEKFNAAMEDVVMRERAGLALWTPLRTSAAFAATVWLRAFEERLEHRCLGVSSPDILGRSILESRHRELGLGQEEKLPIELQVSERISELMRQQKSQEQAARLGQSA